MRRATMLLADDHAIVAEGIATLLRSEFTVVGTVGDGHALLKAARELRPDVVVTDVGMPGLSGLDALRQLKAEANPAKFVLLTMHADPELATESFRAGASAFLVKSAAGKELITAIRDVLLGRTYLTPLLAKDALAAVAGPRTRPFGARVVRRQLEQVLKNPDFDAASRSREFLRFIVEETIAGRGETITQSAIATRVFGRKDDFDAMVDPIVRIQAGRLRRSLERYYLLSGKSDPIRIELPKGTYVPVFASPSAAVAGAGMPERNAPPEALRPERRAAADQSDDGWPSVAVGQFELDHDGSELQDVARRLREELAAELGGYSDVRVLRDEWEGPGQSRRHGGRFSLSGRLRREEDGLRVSVRLVDRTTGEQVWADEYHTAPKADRWIASLDDIARVIAARVGSEEGVIVRLLMGERRHQGLAEPKPYDAMLQSLEFFLARDAAGLSPALDALQRLVRTEPECAPAWTRLARLYTSNVAFDVTPIPTPIDDAISYAHNGVRLDPTGRKARAVLAGALLIKGELTAAREELDQALRFQPDSLVYLELIGWVLTMCGDWERGPSLMRMAQKRNPHCLPHASLGLWVDHVRRGEFETAYKAALEYRESGFFWRALMRACSLGHLARLSEAETEVADLLRRKPDFKARGRVLIGHFIKFEEVTSRIVEGLAKAGLDLE